MQSPKSPLLAEWHRTHLTLPGVSCVDTTCKMVSAGGGHETLPRVCIRGGSCRYPLLGMQNFQTPRKQVFSIKHSLYNEFRHSYQFWKWWELLRNPSSQRPAKDQPFMQVFLRISLKTAHTIIISSILHISKSGKRSEVTLAHDQSPDKPDCGLNHYRPLSLKSPVILKGMS